jgi:hypothetical protein
MRFAIMTWVPSSDNAKIGTIFGILDNDAPGDLPLLPGGHCCAGTGKSPLFAHAPQIALQPANDAGPARWHRPTNVYDFELGHAIHSKAAKRLLKQATHQAN